MNYTLFSYSSSSPSCYLQLPVIRRTTPFWYPQHYSQWLWNILYIIQLPVVRQTTPPPCCPQHYSQCWWNILSYQTWCLGAVLVYRAWLKKIVGQLPLYCNQAVLCCSSWAIGLPFTDWGLWWDLFVLSRGGIPSLISMLRGPEISNAFPENDAGHR